MSSDQKKALATPTPHRILKSLVVISLLLAATGTVIAVLSFQHLQRWKSQMGHLQRAQKDFEHQFNEKFQQKEAQFNQFMAESTNISTQQARIQAASLVNLAKLHLKYGANVTTAMQLLQIAQQQLLKFHAPELEPLQQGITGDIQQLEKVTQANPITLLNTLDDIMLQIKKIPIIPHLSSPKVNATTPALETTWRKKIKNSLDTMKAFVVVRKINNPSAFALSPDERLLIKQSILIKLSLTQWAVINKEEKIYQESLSAAKKMLATLPIENEQIQKITTSIDTLLSTSLQPTSPMPTFIESNT